MKQNDAKMVKIDIVNFGEKIQKAKENMLADDGTSVALKLSRQIRCT